MAEVWPEVAFTAHRRLDRAASAWSAGRLADAVAWLRDERGMTHGHCGMAAGGDLLWAEALVTAGMPFVAHVPYPQQPERWPARDRLRWETLCAAAAATVPYGDLDAVPEERRKQEAVRLLHARNDGMLNLSQVLVALWSADRPRGGTWSAVRKAGLRGMPVVWLDPDGRTTAVIGPERVAELVERAPVPQRKAAEF